ncbi:unnamed protein product [Urochloa humidicola]
MVSEEARLRFAIIAQVGNASREFTPTAVSHAVAAETGLEDDCYPTIHTFPESFLIICTTQDARDRALAASPVPIAATHLSLRPWTRLVRADSRVLFQRVSIEIDGIPEHAWDIDTASKLLARHAWVERLDPVTVAKTDMSTFKLTAWTDDPFSLPASKTLCIAEPELHVVHSDEDMQRIFANVEPYLRQKSILKYPVHFHLRSIADFRSRTPSSSDSSPSDDGDSGPDGNPNRSYGFRRGVGPRLSGFPRCHTGANGGGRTGGASTSGAAAVQHVIAGDVGKARGPQRPGKDGTGKSKLVGAQSEKTTPSASGRDQMNSPEADSNNRCATIRDEVDTTTVAAAFPVLPADTTVETGSTAVEDGATACVLTRDDPRQLEADPMLIEVAAQEGTALPTPVALAPCAALSEPSRTAACSPVRMDPGREGQLDLSASESGGEISPVATATTVTTPTWRPKPMGCNAEPFAGPAQEDEPTGEEEDDRSPPGFPRTRNQSTLMEVDTDSSPPAFSRAVRDQEAKILAFTSQVQARIRSPLAPRPMKIKRIARTLQAERDITALVNQTHPMAPRHPEENQSGGHQATLGSIPGDGPCVDADSDPDSPPGFSRAAARQEAKLRAFTSQVQAKIRSPLAPRPAKTKRIVPVTPRDELPKRSLRLASHPMANVPSAKRAEVILMQRFGLIPEGVAVNTEGKKAYEKLYKEEGLATKNFEAMRDLLPALKNASPFLGMKA